MRWDAPHPGPLGSSTASGRSPSRPSTSIRSGRRRCCPGLYARLAAIRFATFVSRRINLEAQPSAAATNSHTVDSLHPSSSQPPSWKRRAQREACAVTTLSPTLTTGPRHDRRVERPNAEISQLVSQPPSGPGLPMWDTIGGMAAPSCIGLSHRLVLVRYCDNGPRPGNVTDG